MEMERISEKEGRKKCNRLRETQMGTKANGGIGPNVEMRLWRKSPSFPQVLMNVSKSRRDEGV